MKKSLIKIVALSAAFTLSVGVAISINNHPIGVEATQHETNYSYYKYSGTYYSTLNTSGADGLNGAFRKSLTSLIYPKGWYIYSGSGSDHLSGVLQSADEDPTNNKNMVYLYTRDSVTKSAATVNGTMIWNREHVWPQSLSINNSGTQCWGTEEAGTDILHLRPTEETTNSTRGNKLYADVNKANPQKYNGLLYGYVSGNYFEPLDDVKGDVARILMYVWTAYTDHYSGLNVTKTIKDYNTLLKWHTMDQPDAMEGLRNDYCVTSKQKNRNPFVDHPEYAWRIFGDSCSSSVKNECVAAYPADGNWTPGGGSSGSSTPAPSSNNNQNTSTAPAVAGTYSVTFANNSADGSSEISGTSVMSNQMTENTLVTSVAGGSKVFAGVNGLKLGSSKANGEISFNITEEAQNNISKIEIESAQYGSDGGKLVVKLDDETLTSSITPGTKYQADLDKVSASTITISTTEKRAYLSKITITVAADEPPVDNPPSSSEPPVTSSESPASSEVASSDPSYSSNMCGVTTETPSDNGSSETPMYSEPVIEPQPEEKGCGGSIIASTSLFAISSLIGLTFIFSKRKHN